MILDIELGKSINIFIIFISHLTPSPSIFLSHFCYRKVSSEWMNDVKIETRIRVAGIFIYMNYFYLHSFIISTYIPIHILKKICNALAIKLLANALLMGEMQVRE
jgi:hypothetical protein